LHVATPRGGVRAQVVRQRPPRKERGKSACGSEQKAAPSRSEAGKSASLKNPAHYPGRCGSGALRGVPAEGVAGDSASGSSSGEGLPLSKII